MLLVVATAAMGMTVSPHIYFWAHEKISGLLRTTLQSELHKFQPKVSFNPLGFFVFYGEQAIKTLKSIIQI